MGIMTSWGGGRRLVQTIRKSKALVLLLTGDAISSEEALRIGLIDRIVEQNQVLSKAKELANKISENAPLSIK